MRKSLSLIATLLALSVVTLFTACPAPTAPAATDFTDGLVITEVTDNGNYSDVPVAVEVYNPTAAAINLSGYYLGTNSCDVSGNFYPNIVFALPAASIPAKGFGIIRGKVDDSLESGGATVYVNAGTTGSGYPWFSPNSGYVKLQKVNSAGTGFVTVDYVHWGSDITSADNLTFTGTIPKMPTGASVLGYSLSRTINATTVASHNAADWSLRVWNTLGGPNDVTSDAASDNDGIPDSAKLPGGTFAGLPLHDWGASPGQRDIFIHIDYMVNGSVAATDPGIIPQKAALDHVVAAFAPHGIAIHFDVGDLYGGPGAANYNLDGRSHAVSYNFGAALGKKSGYANIYQYKAANMPINKTRAFFYMLFGDTQTMSASGGSSGIANLPGNNALITLGHWGLDTTPGANLNKLVNYQASTMMHEFGHNLGLHHGGDVDDNYKPNYFSIMNYLYQLSGLPSLATADTRFYYAYHNAMGNQPAGLHTAWQGLINPTAWADGPTSGSFKFTYSDGSIGSDINENAADETKGVGRTGSVGIDFDNLGSVSGTVGADIRYDLDPNLSTKPTRTTLKDFNDWGAISSVFQHTFIGTASGTTEVTQRSLSPSATSIQSIFNSSSLTVSPPCAPNPEHPVQR